MQFSNFSSEIIITVLTLTIRWCAGVRVSGRQHEQNKQRKKQPESVKNNRLTNNEIATCKKFKRVSVSVRGSGAGTGAGGDALYRADDQPCIADSFVRSFKFNG